MGVPVETAPDRLRVTGKGLWGLREPDSIVDCGNSGTGIRLLAGVLAGQDFSSVLTGDASIGRRPMGRVVGPLGEMGAVIAGRRGGELAPLAVVGARLRGIAYSSPIASAQVKSSVLLAGLFAEGTTSVTEPALSRDHTERLFAYLGIPVTRNVLTVSLTGQRAFTAKDIAVAGDPSAAAFFLVAASLGPHSEGTITGGGVNPTRTGGLEILQAQGADIGLVNPPAQAGGAGADPRGPSSPLR